MRIKIDRSLCSGHGRCFSLAPEIFGYDDEGLSIPKYETLTPDLVTAARLGADSCPEQAIALEDG